jgi:hypothetical protein
MRSASAIRLRIRNYLTACAELVDEPDVPADPQPVSLDRAFAAAADDRIAAQQPPADPRLAQPDR